MNPELFAELSGLWCVADDLVDLRRFVDWAAKARAAEPEQAKPRAAARTAGPTGRAIAEVPIRGMMLKSTNWYGASTQQVKRDVRAAAAEPEVGGILLSIDSPGGIVAGTDDLAAEIRAANKKKPVWTFAEDLMASAAYWAGSQAERVVANSASALVGSIGTYQVIYDVSAALEQMGVKAHVFKTGPLKAIGVEGAPVTEDQVQHLQSIIDGLQQIFEGSVAKARGLSAKAMSQVNHGGTFLATEALQKGLIDAIDSKERTLAEFARALGSPSNGRRPAKSESRALLPRAQRRLPTVTTL